MNGYTTEKMWDAIERLASISSSTTSNIQRTIHKAFQARQAVVPNHAKSETESSIPEAKVKPMPTFESETGKIVSSKG